MTCAKIFGSGRADGSPPQAGCDTARIADEVVRPRAETCGSGPASGRIRFLDISSFQMIRKCDISSVDKECSRKKYL